MRAAHKTPLEPGRFDLCLCPMAVFVPDVSTYSDYRAYLRDYYAARKASGRGFSYRSFSRRAGLKSPNYLKLVIDGERNLSPQMAEQFARACGLEADAARHFVALVVQGQAGGTDVSEATLTLRVGRRSMAAVRQRIARLQHELLELAADDTEPEHTLQISFQLSPLNQRDRVRA